MADTLAVPVISLAGIDDGGYAIVYRVSSDAYISDLVIEVAKGLDISHTKLRLWTVSVKLQQALN